jgi:hypothetical protein
VGQGYFGINRKGQVTVRLADDDSEEEGFSIARFLKS